MCFPVNFLFFSFFFENFNTSWLLAQGSPLDMTMKTRHIYSSRVVRKIQEFLTFTVLHQPDLFRSSFVHISLILSVRIICAAAATPVLFQSRVKGITVPWCKRGTKNCPQSPPYNPPSHSPTPPPLPHSSSSFLPNQCDHSGLRGNLCGTDSPPHLCFHFLVSLGVCQSSSMLAIAHLFFRCFFGGFLLALNILLNLTNFSPLLSAFEMCRRDKSCE